MSIYQEYLKTEFGNILIEADEEVITSIRFVQDEKCLDSDAPKNILTNYCSKQLKEYFDGMRRIFNFPYKLSGTEFQNKVWAEIAKIPYGKTMSYKELAERINMPQSVKSIIAAAMENNLFLCVPCHRLIDDDNNFVDFAPKPTIKEQLLELEKEPEVYTKYNYLQLQQKRGLPPNNLITGRFLYEIGNVLFETDPDEILEPNKIYSFSVDMNFTGKSGFSLEATAFVATEDVILTFYNASNTFVTKTKLSPNQNTLYFDINDMPFDNVYKITIISKNPLKDVRIRALNVADNFFRYKGQSHFYNAIGGILKEDNYTLRFTLNGKAAIESPIFPDSSNTVFNMKLPRRNTVFMVLKNNSTATQARLFYKTTLSPVYTEDNYVELKLSRSSDFKAYYFNLSNTPGLKLILEDCRLLQFKLEAVGQGEIILKEYSFEEEKPILQNAGSITSCIAENSDIKIAGLVSANYVNQDYNVSIYESSFTDETFFIDNKTLLISVPLSEATVKTEITGDISFSLSGIPFNGEKTTRLPSQFAAFLENEFEVIPLGERFYIDNYFDFEENPYEFSLPENTVYVTDYPFNAKGDSFTDDTGSIQMAIDTVWKQGGGKVVIPGVSLYENEAQAFYGRRYRITNLLLRSRVELHIEKGAILWQSPIFRDYKYVPSYGHDVYVENIPWSHALHVANLPTIQCYDSEYVKITGAGKIRSVDTGAEEGVVMPTYSTGCPDRIHQVPIGFFKVKNIELSDFELVRTNNYHVALYACSYIYAGNVKMHEVRCVSGDGFGISKGTHHVVLNRNFFISNDDGVVLSGCYHDPRGIVWWKSNLGAHGGTRQIRVCHSYINSGGGKAIAFIPWGTSDFNYEMQEISGITVFDNVLVCVNPVGVWPDNPYKGKVPFDNTELDDYSPVKSVRIYGNVYEGNTTLGPVQATDFLSDIDLFSSNKFQNNDFCISEIPNLANWSYKLNKNKKSISVKNIDGHYAGVMQYFREGDTALYQGLHLKSGAHKCLFEIMTGETGAFIFVQNIRTGEILTERHVTSINSFELFEIKFTLSMDLDLYIGLRHPADMTSDLEFTALKKADIESV